MDKWNMSQEQIARVLGKSQSGIANKLRLLRHSPRVLQAIREGGLSERHARALLKLEGEYETLKAIDWIVRQDLSVAKTESYIKSLCTPIEKTVSSVSVDGFLKQVNQTLGKIRLSGVAAVSECRETASQIVLTITLPK